MHSRNLAIRSGAIALSLAACGFAAHAQLPPGDGPTTVSFPTSKLSKGADYTFFCSFPGHWAMMKGTLTFG